MYLKSAVSPPSSPAKSELTGIAHGFEKGSWAYFKLQSAEIFHSVWIISKICDFHLWYNLTFGRVCGFVQKGEMSSVAKAAEGHILHLKFTRLIFLFQSLQKQLFIELSNLK